MQNVKYFMRIRFSTTETCLVAKTSALELGTCSSIPFRTVRTRVTDLNSVYLEMLDWINRSTIAPLLYKSLGVKSKLNILSFMILLLVQVFFFFSCDADCSTCFSSTLTDSPLLSWSPSGSRLLSPSVVASVLTSSVASVFSSISLTSVPSLSSSTNHDSLTSLIDEFRSKMCNFSPSFSSFSSSALGTSSLCTLLKSSFHS